MIALVFVALIGTAFVMMIVIPLVGAMRFRPHEARNIKYAERLADGAIQQHVIAVASTHHEIVRVDRLDRHPFYVLTMAATWCYAWCVAFGAELTSNVAVLSETTQITMSTCFLIGGTFTMIGATLGARVGRWRIMRRVYDHPTMSVLGDDITLPYWLASAGLTTISVSMAIYSWTSFGSTTGSLGGWLTGALAVACALVTVMLLWRIQTFERQSSTLIVEALARMGLEHNADG